MRNRKQFATESPVRSGQHIAFARKNLFVKDMTYADVSMED
jgi:hypothetical protein